MSEALTGRVSVIIPARNEESNIARAVRSVAAQREVRELIVADDQSSDRTGEILEELKVEFPQLRVIRIESLPNGWMGKAHALASAARLASGEWLLFTDADTEHRPGSLATLLERAEAENVDLLSLSPGQHISTWWEKAVIPLVYVNLACRYRFESVSDPNSSDAAANGQYILIRRAAYQRAGGHEAVRAEILDDVALACRVKADRGRILFLPGASWVQTRMYRTFSAMWEGWTKNLYTLYGGKLTNILESVMDDLLVDWLPVFVLLVFLVLIFQGARSAAIPLSAVLGAAACLLVVGYGQWTYRRALLRLDYDASVAKYIFIGAPLLSILLLNSALAHAQGRVRWKGRDYPAKKSAKGNE